MTLLSPGDWQAIGVSLRLAAVTTVMLLTIGIPVAWWLSRSQWKLKFLVEALVAMPLVLPPTVLGFYLLLLLGPDGWLGQVGQATLGRPLAFTFTGLVIGSIAYSIPFVVQPLQVAFSAIDQRYLDAAATLGAGPFDRFRTIVLPMARPGLLTAATLGFAHTIGEFGVVLMIGGSIPGQTRVASIAVFQHVESLQTVNAHALSGVLLVLSFGLLATVFAINRRFWLVHR